MVRHVAARGRCEARAARQRDDLVPRLLIGGRIARRGVLKREVAGGEGHKKRPAGAVVSYKIRLGVAQSEVGD